MTYSERESSQNKQIITKLEKLEQDVSTIRIDVSSMKKQAEMQPSIESGHREVIYNKINDHDKRIRSLETNQRWFVLAVLLAIINAIMQLVLH